MAFGKRPSRQSRQAKELLMTSRSSTSASVNSRSVVVFFDTQSLRKRHGSALHQMALFAGLAGWTERYPEMSVKANANMRSDADDFSERIRELEDTLGKKIGAQVGRSMEGYRREDSPVMLSAKAAALLVDETQCDARWFLTGRGVAYPSIDSTFTALLAAVEAVTQSALALHPRMEGTAQWERLRLLLENAAHAASQGESPAHESGHSDE